VTYLDLVDVLELGADLDSHLDTITRGVGTVGGGHVEDIRAVLLEQRVGLVVSSVATGSDDDDTVLGEGLAVVLVLGTDDSTGGVGDELGGAGAGDETGALGLLGSDLLVHLHQRVGDGHTGETLSTAVGAGERVATETGDEREVELELVNEPLDRGGGLAAHDLSEGVGGAGLGGRDSVGEEGLDGVLDVELDLGGSQRGVDTGGSLGGGATEEGVLVEEEHVGAVLEGSVGRGEAGEAAAEHDNLGHRHGGKVVCRRETKAKGGEESKVGAV